jgi:hypothetical protein
MSFDTFLGWPTYPALFTCSYCGETCDIDYAYEHDHCEPPKVDEVKEIHAQLKRGGSNISLGRLREICKKQGLTKEELELELVVADLEEEEEVI